MYAPVNSHPSQATFKCSQPLQKYLHFPLQLFLDHRANFQELLANLTIFTCINSKMPFLFWHKQPLIFLFFFIQIPDFRVPVFSEDLLNYDFEMFFLLHFI